MEQLLFTLTNPEKNHSKWEKSTEARLLTMEKDVDLLNGDGACRRSRTVWRGGMELNKCTTHSERTPHVWVPDVVRYSSLGEMREQKTQTTQTDRQWLQPWCGAAPLFLYCLSRTSAKCYTHLSLLRRGRPEAGVVFSHILKVSLFSEWGVLARLRGQDMFLWAYNFQGLHWLFSSLCFPMLHSDMGEGAFPFCLQTCEKTKAVPNRSWWMIFLTYFLNLVG